MTDIVDDVNCDFKLLLTILGYTLPCATMAAWLFLAGRGDRLMAPPPAMAA